MRRKIVKIYDRNRFEIDAMNKDSSKTLGISSDDVMSMMTEVYEMVIDLEQEVECHRIHRM